MDDSHCPRTRPVKLGSEEYNDILRSLKVPVPKDEWLRLTTLRECNVLDSSTCDPDFDRYTALCARSLNVPMCLVVMVDLDRQWFKSKIGLDIDETHRDVSFCTHTIMASGPSRAAFVVPNCFQHPLFSQNPFVVGEPGIKFYAGVPLQVEGVNIGTLCVMDFQARDSFSEADETNLIDIGGIVAQVVASRRNQFLREHRKQSQQLLSLTHNLRTSCTSLEMSVKSLVGDMGDMISSLTSTEDGLSFQTDQLVQLVSQFTDLCGLMPSLSPTGPQRSVSLNGYKCQMGEIIKSLSAIVHSVCADIHLSTTVDPRLLLPPERSSYDCFPELFVMSTLALIKRYSKASDHLVLNIYAVDGHDAGSLESSTLRMEDMANTDDDDYLPEMTRLVGVVAVELLARECRPPPAGEEASLPSQPTDDDDDTVLRQERRIHVAGGGTCTHMNRAGQGGGSDAFYRFWLPISIRPSAKCDNKKRQSLLAGRKRISTASPRAISSSESLSSSSSGSSSASLTCPGNNMPINVLVMDDDASAQRVLKKILRAHNCQVSVRSNGLQGLKEFKRAADSEQREYDLVFVDLLMPVMHGGTVMQEVSVWNQQRVARGLSPTDTTFIGMMPDDDDCSVYFEATQRCSSVVSGASDTASPPMTESSPTVTVSGPGTSASCSALQDGWFSEVIKKPVLEADIARIVTKVHKDSRGPNALPLRKRVGAGLRKAWQVLCQVVIPSSTNEAKIVPLVVYGDGTETQV